jgi:hypothetical protein
MFYGWTIGVEILVLVVGGFSRISSVLASERKAGLWDSNRLTPLQPWQLVTGYWFGPPLREFYMAVVLAGTGLAIVLLGKLSPALWLGTQLLIFSTALFFGLIALLIGLVVQRPQSGVIIAALALVLPPMFSFIMPKYTLTSFLVPMYSIASFFNPGQLSATSSIQDWNGMPDIFGVAIYPILLSLGLQLVTVIFLWRAAVRKTKNVLRPPLLRWEAVALFAILIFTQHGLMWGLWHGQFPKPIGSGFVSGDDVPMLSIVHGGTLLLAAVVLAFASPQPERVRVESLRLGFKNLGSIFPRSAVSLALLLTVVAAAALLTQCAFSIADSWRIYVVATGNLLSFVLIFSLLLEYCRLRFRRRALGFVALWLFVLCILPFILAGVFTTAALGRLSLFSPGVLALAGPDMLNDPDGSELNYLVLIVLAHFGIAAALFFAWRDQWQRLLARSAAGSPTK